MSLFGLRFTRQPAPYQGNKLGADLYLDFLVENRVIILSKLGPKIAFQMIIIWQVANKKMPLI